MTVVTVIGADVRPRWEALLAGTVLLNAWTSRARDVVGARQAGTDTLIEFEPVPKRVMTREHEVFTIFPSYVEPWISRYDFLSAVPPYDYGGLLSARDERFAEAVAVGGLEAARGNRRRVVIAVASLYDLASSGTLAAQIRAYVQTLDVPLVPWTPDKQVALRYNGPWGRIEYLSKGNLGKANRTLCKSLERLRIIWVEGTFLPQEIELVSRDLGLALAR